jgi:hypothetical protein
VIGPEQVAAHVVASLEHERGESTVPRYYGVAGVVQALAPNVLSRGLANRIGRQ